MLHSIAEPEICELHLIITHIYIQCYIQSDNFWHAYLIFRGVVLSHWCWCPERALISNLLDCKIALCARIGKFRGRGRSEPTFNAAGEPMQVVLLEDVILEAGGSRKE